MLDDTLDGHKLAKEYERYFDDCEKANKIPLGFNEWLEQQKKKD